MKGKQDIAIIQEKQKQLDYESFVKYLFDIGLFKNKYLREGVNVYDITPTNKEQAEILERISIEHAKNNPSGFFEKPTKLKSKLLVPFVPFESLKQKLQKSLEAPFADKEAVISNYKKQYLEPLQETKNEDTAQRIYKSFKTGKADNIGKKDYFYYATKAAVMELLKFEDYLNTLSAHKKNEKTPQPDNSEKENILFPKLKAFLSNYDYFVKSDNSSLNKVLNIPFSDQLKSIDDLIDELKKLLLSKETKEAKAAIFKNHIVDLMEIWSLFKFHEDLINSEIPKPKNEFEKYVLLCHELNLIVFNEFQMLCHTNGISFFELCKDLKVEPEFIDSSISIYFEEDQPQLDISRNSYIEKKPKSKKKKLQSFKDKTPKTFEDLFYNPKEADSYLEILNKVDPPFICENNKYIGSNKGIFPLWVNLLTRKTKIKSFPDKTIYSRLLNKKIENLNLSKDASEFRKHYKRIDQSDYSLQIMHLISQISQSGKLGK